MLSNPPSSGKLHLRAGAAFPHFYHHSLFFYIISPRLASPPPLCCLVFSSCLCSYLLPHYFNFDYVLFFLLLPPPPPLPLRFPGPHFLSLGEFWIRESFWCQAATILHVNKKDGWKHSESCTETFSPASFPCLVLLW